MARWLRRLLASSLALLVPASALAQDEAAAAALFDRGLADMKDGKFATGCPALAESYRLDPKAGALFTLATCEARWGRIATAVVHYDEYLRLFARLSPQEQAKQKGRDKVAENEKAALIPQVPDLTLTLPASTPAGTTVTRDGVAVGAASLGVALPVNPGEHVIVSHVPGAAPHEQRVTIEKGEHKSLVIELDTRPAAQGTAPTASAAAPTTSSTAAPTAGPLAGSSPMRTAGFVAGGVGVAGLVAGAVVGSLLFDKKATITAHCDGLVCDHQGKLAADSAQGIGLASEIAFGAGAAALVGGVILLLAAPPRPMQRGALVRPHIATDGMTGAVLGAEGAF